MNSVIPSAFTFHFALPVSRLDRLPLKGKRLLDLPEECRVFWPSEALDGPRPTHPGYPVAAGTSDWLDLRLAWNLKGFGVSLRVRGKQHPPVSDVQRPESTDGFQIWIDTRDTRTIHRANRFCHGFCLLPNGAGATGEQATVRQVSVGRSVEEAPTHAPEKFRIASQLERDGYLLEAWLPTETLNGFDVETCPQLGFYCQLTDAELGTIPFTVANEFPYSSDPSLWQTLDLTETSPESR